MSVDAAPTSEQLTSASSPHEAPIEGLRATLRRELELAHTRVEALVARRRTIEKELDAALAAEREGLRSLASLQAVASHTGESKKPALSGASLREMAARVALRNDANGRAVHWREWLGWLHGAGFEAAGKRPEATFLTQLARSPFVRRGRSDGMYILDVTRFVEECERLHTLHQDLAQIPPPDQMALLGDTRSRRREADLAIARTERVIEEMWRILRAELPADWDRSVEPNPDRLIERWTAGRHVGGQQRLT